MFLRAASERSRITAPILVYDAVRTVYPGGPYVATKDGTSISREIFLALARAIRKKLAGSKPPGMAFPPLSPERCFSTSRLGTYIPEDVSLPVQAGDKHRPAVLVATRLVVRDNGWLIPSRRHVAQ
jgi:hypothetical protein